MTVKGRVAIVTGASSGMGKEFVKQLSGYVKVDEVWVIARREQALKDLQALCPYPIRPLAYDLGKEESFMSISALLEKEQPDVKLLVNAACAAGGPGPDGPGFRYLAAAAFTNSHRC